MSFDPREDVLLVLSYARFCLAAALGEQELCEQWGGGSLPGSLITVRAAPWEQGVGVGVDSWEKRSLHACFMTISFPGWCMCVNKASSFRVSLISLPLGCQSARPWESATTEKKGNVGVRMGHRHQKK